MISSLSSASPRTTPDPEEGHVVERRTSAYLLATVLAAAGLGAAVWTTWGAPTPTDPALALLLVGLAVAAQHFPFRLGPQHKANAAIGSYFAALLLFGPPTAMALTAASQLLGGITLHLRRNARTGRRRRGLPEVAFNTAQLTLAVGLAGLMGTARFLPAAPPSHALAISGWGLPVAAGTAYLVNSGLVAVMIGLDRRRNPVTVWRSGRWAASVEAMAVLGLGLATATVAAQSAWMVLLLALPAGLLQRSLQRGDALLAERQATATRLKYQAFHDPLTDLPNRAFLRDRLAQARDDGRASRPAVLYLDLDNFKVVNDSLGHAAGDQLLVAVARRIQAALRPQDMVARLGGDEFLLLLEATPEVDTAVRVAERLTAAVAAPLSIDGQVVRVTASIGIAYSDPATDPDEWLRQADIALHEAKAAGKTRHVVADRAMTTRAERRLSLEQELRWALEQGELAVHYQPQLALATGRIVGWEALVRWRHPARGAIAPGAFIPLAEETGLILPLGEWVLGEACRQAARWRRASATPLTMSVNLSMRQFRHADLVGNVAAALATSGLAADGLTLELTESLAMEDQDASIAILSHLGDLGVRLALDDFGSGYSSLRSLQRLPLDVLKVDRSLVAELGRDQRAQAILQAVVTLGHTLGLLVVAEGIETAVQVASVRELHCDVGQGYHFGRPMAAAAAEARMTEQSGWHRVESAAG